MKIKCPSCDKSYRTYDAILTHLGQTGCKVIDQNFSGESVDANGNFNCSFGYADPLSFQKVNELGDKKEIT